MSLSNSIKISKNFSSRFSNFSKIGLFSRFFLKYGVSLNTTLVRDGSCDYRSKYFGLNVEKRLRVFTLSRANQKFFAQTYFCKNLTSNLLNYQNMSLVDLSYYVNYSKTELTSLLKPNFFTPIPLLAITSTTNYSLVNKQKYLSLDSAFFEPNLF